MSIKSNLKKLAIYLSTKRPSKAFSMESYMEDESGCDVGVTEAKKHPECGTVCCAVGNGPRAGIPIGRSESWIEYIYKFIDREAEGHFEWLFDYNWVYHDNTPKGAAYRIGYMIKCGMPEWFSHVHDVATHKDKYKECLRIGKEYIDSLKRD